MYESFILARICESQGARMRKTLPLLIAAALLLPACSAEEDANPPPADAAVPGPEDARLVSYLQEKFLAVAPVQYLAGRADLDGDGTDEVLAYVSGELACSPTGCPLLVLKDDGTSFTEVAKINGTNLPVGMLDSSSNGWRDLWSTAEASDGATSLVKLVHDDKAYPAKSEAGDATKLDKPGTEIIAAGDLKKVN